MEKLNQRFDPDKIKDFQTWEELSEEIFPPKKLKEMKEKALKRAKIRNNLSNKISKIVTQYMDEHHIGFNELVRRLDMSTATVSKIIKGNSNITLETIAEISLLIGKNIYIDAK